MQFVVLILALWNVFRIGVTIATWQTLQEFAPHPGPWYILLTGLFWTVASIAAWLVLRRRFVHAQGVYALTIYAYIAWWWADRLLFFQQPRTNGPFAIAVTIIVILAVASDFFNPHATAYFTQRENYEQSPKDQ